MMRSTRTPFGTRSIGGRVAGLGLAVVGALATAVLVATASSAQDMAASSAPEVELTPLTFTARQVIVGRSAYGSGCAGCHGEDLTGLDGPPLIQPGWHWFDGTVADLFTYIHTSMPLDNPGTLSTRQVAGIVALIADANGYVAGDVALPEDPADLTGMGFNQPE